MNDNAENVYESISSNLRFVIPTSDVSSGYLTSIEKLTEIEQQNILYNCQIHKDLLDLASSPSSAWPIYYIGYHSTQSIDLDNNRITRLVVDSSSDSLPASVTERYCNLENLLLELGNPKLEDDEGIEEGAIGTSLAIMHQLKNYSYPPPEISWHGGDAVVMLWALGNTTYAITITDGELGYVVRRNRETVKKSDSISLETFSIQRLLS